MEESKPEEPAAEVAENPAPSDAAPENAEVSADAAATEDAAEEAPVTTAEEPVADQAEEKEPAEAEDAPPADAEAVSEAPAPDEQEATAAEEAAVTEEVAATEAEPASEEANVEPAAEGDEAPPADVPAEGEGEGAEEQLADGAPAEGEAPAEDGEPEPVETEQKEDEQIENAEMFLEEELIPLYNRDELIQRYQIAVNEREQCNQQNQALQHKLAEYFKKKKTEEARHEADKNVTDQEQRYMKYVNNLEDLRQQQMAEQEEYNERLEEMKERKAEKQAKVEEEWHKSIEFKKSVAAAAINSRSGRPICPKDIETYEINERKKEAEVSQVRLENIKLKNRLLKQEQQLKQKEELAEGLHLIDFEQLKIENQTYNEKIEERNEELLKLRKKITSTVQVLTHLKEKLQFVQAENQVKKQQLSDVDLDVAQKRDILSRTKQTRDALRQNNAKLQQKCGLLGNYDLLRDFEETHDEGDDLKQRLDSLKRTHAELTLNLNGVKKKIELAKENQTWWVEIV